MRGEFIKATRINQKITAPNVNLVEEGKAPRVVSIDEALAVAEGLGMDLVEVNPNSKPPIVKLMDYGKFLYKKKKQEQTAKKSQKKTEVKTIRFGFRTSEHDLEIKRNQAIKFLEKGCIIKIQVIGRGRELAYKESAIEKVKKFVASLEDTATVEQPIKSSGHTILCMLRPTKK